MSDTPTGLEHILSISNARATYHNQVKLAEAKFSEACVTGFSGGQFRITPEFLVYLKSRVDIEADRAVVLDANNLPILIEDLVEFYTLANSIYHEALNEYYEEVQRLKKSRKLIPMMELDADE